MPHLSLQPTASRGGVWGLSTDVVEEQIRETDGDENKADLLYRQKSPFNENEIHTSTLPHKKARTRRASGLLLGLTARSGRVTFFSAIPAFHCLLLLPAYCCPDFTVELVAGIEELSDAVGVQLSLLCSQQ